MSLEETIIIGSGGNASHLPSHTLEACLSAYTAGADGIMLTVQETSDGHLLLYEHSDLSIQTDGNGRIGSHTLDQIMELDAGARFSPGEDSPWVRNKEVSRFSHLTSLEMLLQALEDNVTYLMKPGLPGDLLEKRIELAKKILCAFQFASRCRPTLVADSISFLDALRSEMPPKTRLALDLTGKEVDPQELFQRRPLIAFSPRVLDISTASGYRVKVGQIINNWKGVRDRPPLVLTPDVTGAREALGLLETNITESWPGPDFDLNRWVAGVSSGHHIMQAMIGISEYKEPVFCASAVADNGLQIRVVEGKTYASAGVVSQFSIGESFVVDVDFTYDNPQVANMMVLAVINHEVWPAYYHHQGVWLNPSAPFQNNAFDTHGAAPFVSMEREEADGFRLMKYTSGAGVYEWYGNWYLGDVGNGQSKKGRLRLERRGRFFSGYYQDEKNDDWIGVGTLENVSMNSRVYLRLGAKHYIKRGAPDPLQSLNVTFRNLIVRRPRGPVYQKGISRDPSHEWSLAEGMS